MVTSHSRGDGEGRVLVPRLEASVHVLVLASVPPDPDRHWEQSGHLPHPEVLSHVQDNGHPQPLLTLPSVPDSRDRGLGQGLSRVSNSGPRR